MIRHPTDTADTYFARLDRIHGADDGEIVFTSADIEAARSEVAETEASLADIEEELGWAALTGDGPACEILVPMAEAAVRDLATAKARLKGMEA